jgi:CheY-like chemotaxis protein
MIFARADSHARRAPMDLVRSVRRTLEMCRRTMDPRIALELTTADPVPAIEGNPGQIEQVLLNICLNARDAMESAGTPAPRIGIHIEPARAHEVRIRVSDNGPGMTEEIRARVFEPFFTTKEIGRGTGLGLATVHGIMEQSGGAVAVQSTLGIGSEFRILLPALASPAVPGEAIAEPVQRATARGGGRVLLVEDDAAVREGVRRMLGASGYEVVEAPDGSAALAALDADGSAFEALVSDVAMPSLDGRELSRAVRARWPALPIVLMSGFADPDAVERDIPGVTFLQKPLDVATLVAAVQGAGRRS